MPNPCPKEALQGLDPRTIDALDSYAPFDLMKFTLTYDGELPSGGNRNSRSKEKWEIRKAIHPQLEELWQTSPTLRRVARTYVPAGGEVYLRWEGHHLGEKTEEAEEESRGRDPTDIHLCAPINVDGIECIPLIRQSLALACSLNILFLRKEEPGSLVFQGGDLDNRIKTLFDALRMPTKDDRPAQQVDLPRPLCCLLESDALINEFTIRADRLLTRPGSNASEVRLVIEAAVKVMHVRSYNMALVGD